MKKYTVMYGHGKGFYHEIEAEDDDDAIDKAHEYMETTEYQDRCLKMLNGCEIYQIMEGGLDCNGNTRVVIWDYFNGKLV